MGLVERLESLGKIALGASLAFYVCYYVWEVGTAGGAGMLAGLIFVICYFGSRHLRNRASATGR